MSRLVDEAKRSPRARTRGLDQLEEGGDLLTLAEFARSTLGTSRYSAVLKDILPPKREPAEPQRLIATTDYRGLITTNYDRLLETALTLERRSAPNTLTPESLSSLATALYEPELFVFKLHGDIGAPESIVLTAQDYDRLILRSPHVRSFLQAAFLTYTLFFVGYSIGDPDFNLMLRELNLIFEGYTPSHYALLPDVPDFTMDHLLDRMGIHVIQYNGTRGHSEVIEVLRTLQLEAPYDSSKS